MTNMSTLNERSLLAFIEAKGACHWREMAEHFECDKRAVVKVLSLLIYKDKVTAGWTTMKVPYVWYRATSVTHKNAGMLRKDSRAEHPELWPNNSVARRKIAHQVNVLERKVNILEAINELGADALIVKIAEHLDTGYPSIRRKLIKLRDEGLVDRLPVQTDRGRPPYVWYVTDQGLALIPEAQPSVEVGDDDDWRSVVRVLDE